MIEYSNKQDSEQNQYVAPPFFQNRELSWLEFNRRVLDQATDLSTPLLERLNFVSIFWSNLQEFFMVRVGSLHDLSLLKDRIVDKKSGWTPSQQLDHIYTRCRELYPYFEQTYLEVSSQIARKGISRLKVRDLSPKQYTFVQNYFAQNVLPFLSPQIVNSRHPFPHLTNGAIYIVVRLNEIDENEKLKDKQKKNKSLSAKNVTLGIIPLPPQSSRVIKLPTSTKGTEFILLEDLIDHFATQIFSMYRVKHTNIICVTRNADLDVVEGEEEQGDDYREHMKRILKKRSRLAPVRLESARPLSEVVSKTLKKRLDLTDQQLFVTQVPLDLSYTYELANLIDDPKLKSELLNEPFSPQWPTCVNKNRSVINQVLEKEILLSYPYDTMDVLVRMLREAAIDPAVVSIKITLYRLASHSNLAEALISAAENGKEVTALFELRARFDEFNNIEWSQRFEEAGCNVIYGFHDYKVHSKICLITRTTPSGTQYITQLGTGNYNEKTAKLYTDMSFITKDDSIGTDASMFFQNMQMETLSDEYKKLVVAPLQIKQMVMQKIDEQIALKKRGKEAGVFFKSNSITDEDVIQKLIEASQAGVECTLLIRGIACIVPGLKGYSENICVVSIVGRLLEHSRIYCFGPMDGSVDVYLSSADLMTRNLDKRVEIAWPVEDGQLKEDIMEYIGICLSDTKKLRALKSDSTYTPLGAFIQSGEEGFDSQQYLIDESKKRESRSTLAYPSFNATEEPEQDNSHISGNPRGKSKESTAEKKKSEAVTLPIDIISENDKTNVIEVRSIDEMKRVARKIAHKKKVENSDSETAHIDLPDENAKKIGKKKDDKGITGALASFLSLFPEENTFKMPDKRKWKK